MKLRDWKDVIDLAPPKVGPITEAAREYTKSRAGRFRGGVRISTGRFWTEGDFKQYRDEIRSKPLP